jgi:hypothetical protein
LVKCASPYKNFFFTGRSRSRFEIQFTRSRSRDKEEVVVGRLMFINNCDINSQGDQDVFWDMSLDISYVTYFENTIPHFTVFKLQSVYDNITYKICKIRHMECEVVF